MGVVLKRFGKKVREFRLEQGLSQEELANKARLHYTYIGSVERGEANLSLQNIEKIANALRVGLPELFAFHVIKDTKEPIWKIRCQLFNLVKNEDLETARNVIKIVKSILSLKNR